MYLLFLQDTNPIFLFSKSTIEAATPPSPSVNYGSGKHSLRLWVLKISVSLRRFFQGTHRLEKYLNLEGFLEKSLKIKSALKSTGKSLKGLEKSLNFTIFCRT